MFIQIIQGHVRDPQACRTTLDRWHRELEPGAVGFLGGTYGFTDDGRLVAIVRFESAAAAQANADRPQQGEWWQEMERHFDGEVSFEDCDDVTLLLGGGSDEAGFVQVIQGRTSDPAGSARILKDAEGLMARARPEILGATLAIGEDGHFTETVAFASEAAAREGESAELPVELIELREREQSMLSDVRYIDLREPWFASRR